MVNAIAFDLYGTLFDVHSVIEVCDERYPGLGAQISQLWRQKQLEYTWLLALMNRYSNFEVVTRKALRFVLNHLKLDYSEEDLSVLHGSYLDLKPFAEVPEALKRMAESKKLAILSNGTSKMIGAVLDRSGLRSSFHSVISVDRVKTYKPSPRVYALGPKILRVPKGKILFVSSNPWDATGAKAYGFKVAWINRSGQPAFDELGYRPDHKVSDLAELARIVS